MMFGELNASGFSYNSTFYNAEFESILSKIILCYQRLVRDRVMLPNNENLIRDCLYLNYLNNNIVRKEIGLKDYYFDREILEDRTHGRTDIRILTSYSFEDTDAYYIVECKRLNCVNTNGATGLNSEYVKNGIFRFISKTYSTFYRTNGMIGFITDTMDIDENVSCISNLMLAQGNSNTSRKIEFREIVEKFKFSYSSGHKVDDINLTLYHLMFDVSKNIHPN